MPAVPRHTMPRLSRLLRLFAVAAATFASVQPPQPRRFDVLIRNGRVMDGTGSAAERADLGITGDRITEIGRLDGATATRIIDATDRIVAPGFIDVHSHAGEGIRNAALHQAQPLLAQGVTTFVPNPDGRSPIDLVAQAAAIEAAKPGLNVALLVGHTSVRQAVIGDARRAPTAEELQKMRELVQRGMEAGAFGLSSGLFYFPAREGKAGKGNERKEGAAAC